MKATFKVTFVMQKGKIKADGKAPIIARIIVNGEMAHFSRLREKDMEQLQHGCRIAAQRREAYP